MQQLLENGYNDIRQVLVPFHPHVVIAYVGTQWNKARLLLASSKLWQNDDMHPEICGSFIGACVIHKTIFNETSTRYRPKGVKRRDYKIIKKLFSARLG